MQARRRSPMLLALFALPLVSALAAPAGAKQTLRGAAILDHPCGKVSLRHMALVHAGKMQEAVELGTPEMQAQWKALPADQREMMTRMMKDTSKSEADFTADITSGGELVVDGKNATLTVKTTTSDADGSSTSTMTQRFVIDGASCAITH